MSKKEEIQNQMMDYLYDEMSPAQRKEFEKILESRPDLQSELNELREMSGLLSSTPSAVPEYKPAFLMISKETDEKSLLRQGSGEQTQPRHGFEEQAQPRRGSDEQDQSRHGFNEQSAQPRQGFEEQPQPRRGSEKQFQPRQGFGEKAHPRLPIDEKAQLRQNSEGQRKVKNLFNPVMKTLLAVAASVLLILLGTSMSGMEMGQTEEGFYLTFGNPPTQTESGISEEQVLELIEQIQIEQTLLLTSLMEQAQQQQNDKLNEMIFVLADYYDDRRQQDLMMFADGLEQLEVQTHHRFNRTNEALGDLIYAISNP